MEVILRTRRPERVVNAEQASKCLTREPSRLSHGEGRRFLNEPVFGVAPGTRANVRQGVPPG
jgi:hypothetical protein